MPPRNKNKEDGQTRGKPQMSVVVHARPMDQQQEQRLLTAVDALLTELVRKEMSRFKKHHD